MFGFGKRKRQADMSAIRDGFKFIEYSKKVGIALHKQNRVAALAFGALGEEPSFNAEAQWINLILPSYTEGLSENAAAKHVFSVLNRYPQFEVLMNRIRDKLED